MDTARLVRSVAGVLVLAVVPLGAADAADGAVLDLSAYERTFTEDFDAVDVSAWGPGTRWIAHTPWAGDFGDARFADPQPGFPFSVKDGILRIEARRGEDGRWRSGLLASTDPSGQGFSQRFGYFEMRAKLPPGEGVWPAFWLIGLDRSTHTAEIDVLEHLGKHPERYTATVHVWDRSGKGQHRSVYQRIPVPRGTLYDRFNTFGVQVDQDWIRFYLNRKEVWRTRTPDEHKQPHYVLLNLGLGSGQSTETTLSPSYMYVDYVHVYSLPEGPTQASVP